MTDRGRRLDGDPVVSWLASGMPPLRARLESRVLERLATGLGSEIRAALAGQPGGDAGGAAVERDVLAALARRSVRLLERVTAREERFAAFSDGYFAAGSPADRRRLAAEHLRREGVRGRALRGDLRALRRHLDHDALRERHGLAVGRILRELEVALAVVARRLEGLGSGGRVAAAAALVGVTGFVPALEGIVDRYRGARVRRAGLRLAALLVAAGGEGASPVGLARRVERIAAAVDEPPFDQVEALRGLLPWGDAAATAVAVRRLTDPDPRAPRDDLLVRAGVARALHLALPDGAWLDALQSVLDRPDPSEHVRQAAVRALAGAGPAAAARAGQAIARCLDPGGDADPSPCVRLACCEALASVARGPIPWSGGGSGGGEPGHLLPVLLEPLRAAALGDGHPLVRRTAVDELASVAERLLATRGRDDAARVWAGALVETLSAAAGRPGAGIDLAAGAAVQRLKPLLDDAAGQVVERLRRALDGATPGGSVRVPLGEDVADEAVEDGLRAAAQHDLGASAEVVRGALVVQRGEGRRVSLARILHEARHRAPDKRQAGPHSVRPRRRGSLRAPPLDMASITPTAVPGEPAVSPVIGSWAPYLPTVDDCLDALENGRAVRLLHPLGATVLRPPRGSRRLRALWALWWRYAALDDLRRRSLEGEEPAERLRFVSALRRLGFAIEQQPGSVRIGDRRLSLGNPVVDQFFGPAGDENGGRAMAVLAGLPSLTALGDQTWNYLQSTGGNSLLHLVAFVSGLGALVLGDAAVQGVRIRRWRRAVPLVIGGWGTRGKSGTERLKAALLASLDVEVLSKTTGNEATVLHLGPGIEPREILLYRPYDKASIWEQRDVLRLGAGLGVDALLWECMALNPRYVEILALGWMRDDLSTVTNCYPDHEDRQGPGGRDVADSISRFVPRGAAVLTAEREMLPVLRQRARERDSRCVAVGDGAAGRISRDLLERFPYEAHPHNVALVAELARELGVEEDEAIASMADHVVPDLGSLKVYPRAWWRARHVTYVNGHSANDRTGLLVNWRRTGLADFDGRRAPGEIVAAVVNNRADRVPRSRVFASILARDVATHVIVLIGTNLGGFTGILRQALRERLAAFRLGDDPAVAAARLERLLSHLHLDGAGPEPLLAQVDGWLRGLGLDGDRARRRLGHSGFAGAARAFVDGRSFGAEDVRWSRVIAAVERDAALEHATRELCAGLPGGDEVDVEMARFVRRQVALHAVAAAARRAVAAGEGGDLTPRVRRLFLELMMERVRPLRDAAATGDQVLDFLVRQLPPGSHARVMGMQNIKGTGLDFVYRWESYARVMAVLGALEEAEDAAAARPLLRTLREHADYGVLDAERASAALERHARRRDTAWAPIAAELALTREHVERILARRREGLARGSAGSRPLRSLLGILERGLDFLHSIRRRRLADRTLDELVHHRISHARAAALMKDVTGAQRGGWLLGRR